MVLILVFFPALVQSVRCQDIETPIAQSTLAVAARRSDVMWRCGALAARTGLG